MKTIAISKVLGSLALLAVVLPFYSSASSMYQSAQFGTALDQIKQTVTIPQSMQKDQRTVVVYCQSDVAATGIAHNISCFDKASYADLQEQTRQVLEGLAFSAAKVDGNAVPVRMYFRVIYSRTGNQPEILMLPNLGTMQREYGVNYVAPQERLDTNDWYSLLLADGRSDAKPFFNKDQLARVVGKVNANGGVQGVGVIEASGRARRDAKIVAAALKSSRFIPGFVDSTPVSMDYIAVVNYPERD